jgi:hypothetical protein
VKNAPRRLHIVATLDEAANDAQEHVARPLHPQPAVA